LAGEQILSCEVGDLLVVNAHLLHRGTCPTDTPRRTIHIELQACNEQTGGQTSWQYMREPGYIDGLPPVTQELMRNAVSWDDNHPLSLGEVLRGRRLSRDIASHEARDSR
jgi:hypothetical protein